jgi:hypothetical protein
MSAPDRRSPEGTPMFDLYHGPELAAHRQAELLDEAATDQLVRSAREGRQSSTDDRPAAAQRVVLLVTVGLSALGGAIDIAGWRAPWS